MDKKKAEKNIAKITRAILPILKKHHIKKAGIFGSFARGEEKKSSDIDILVELRKGKSLFDLIHLEQELEKKTKRKVQAVTYKSIHPILKERILQEEVQIYGKGS